MIIVIQRRESAVSQQIGQIFSQHADGGLRALFSGIPSGLVIFQEKTN